jgi:hypothetical protein
MLKRVEHRPEPLPLKIKEDHNPLTEFVSCFEHIARSNAARLLSGQGETLRSDIEKLLHQVYSAGIEAGMHTKQKIDELI